ncbi:class I SAM-dependent methyltransferase [Candidatus Kapabacteria bacterium]|nr:class I SAM-dependent methyltransferase [Candidatus Kapabacteria bacterium]
MTIDELKNNLLGIPHTSAEDGEILHNFLMDLKPSKILELGFDHGVSTCWMALAAQKLEFEIDSIDRPDALNSKPDIYQNLTKNGLEKFVNVIISERTYIWELRNLISKNSTNGVCKPIYDFCFIDGAHTWETDGFAFFLVEKLLKPGGWILFDDINWTIAESKSLAQFDWVKDMPKEEKNTPHVKEILELLVSQHPNFDNFRIQGKWAWVKKTSNSKLNSINFEKVYKKPSIKNAFLNFLYAIKKNLI